MTAVGGGRAVLATATVDAIIVPTYRPPPALGDAVALAQELRCPLVVLCSGRASTTGTVELAARSGVDVVALDVSLLPDGLLPRFRTTRMLMDGPFEWRSDLALKRNLGLLLAGTVGWRRVLLLDDDIRIDRVEDVNDAAALLDHHDVVGLAVEDFPDHSVVRHAHRAVGGRWDRVPGSGGAVVVRPSVRSLFPDVYNDDLFFFLDTRGLRPAAITGRAAQKSYDPFEGAHRARSEEFGDCVAEGLRALHRAGRETAEADERFWRGFLAERISLIDEITVAVDAVSGDVGNRRSVVAALRAARDQCLLIEPTMCVDYLTALEVDRAAWSEHVERLLRACGAPVLDVERALVALDLDRCAVRARAGSSRFAWSPMWRNAQPAARAGD